MAIAKPNMTLLWAASGINVAQPSDQQITDGWIAEKPPYQTENWVQNRSDVYLKHIDSKGIPEWGSTSEYDRHSMCIYNDIVWESLQNNNTNHIPTDGGGWWQSWQPLDKKRGGQVQNNIEVINNKGFITRYTDGSACWLAYAFTDNVVYMGAVTDINGQNSRVNLMQGGQVRASINPTYTQWNTVLRSTIAANNVADLTRKDYVDNGDAATLASANAYTNSQIGASSIPIGAIMAWPTEVPPTGWALLHGQAVSRTTYSALFNLLGTYYGVGNGSTTFNFPDYRGEFLRGRDNGKGSDPDAALRTNAGNGATGDQVGTKQLDNIRTHQHNAYVNVNSNWAGGPNVGPIYGNSPQLTTGGPTGNETRPRNVYVNWIMYTGVTP